MERYDVLKFISEGKGRALSPENEVLARVADDIRRATDGSRTDEAQSGRGSDNVVNLNEEEQRCAEAYAKAHKLWISFFDLDTFGIPGPCGSEANTYVSRDGYVYKVNNMLHCSGSIVATLEKFILHNIVFPDTKYTFAGFTGFDGRSIYPVVKQTYIKDCAPVGNHDIQKYMSALGFMCLGNGIYQNDFILAKDVLPKNVLIDSAGDIYVIDVELNLI